MRPVSRAALRSAASTTIAVPCWSSWKTGMSRRSCSRRSISKQRGAVMSSRLMPPKRRRQPRDGLDDLVDVRGVQADRHRVDAAELLEQHRLALHHRQRGRGPDVAEPEHRGAVGDDGDDVRHARCSARASVGSAAIACADPADARACRPATRPSSVAAARPSRRISILPPTVQVEDGVDRSCGVRRCHCGDRVRQLSGRRARMPSQRVGEGHYRVATHDGHDVVASGAPRRTRPRVDALAAGCRARTHQPGAHRPRDALDRQRPA